MRKSILLFLLIILTVSPQFVNAESWWDKAKTLIEKPEDDKKEQDKQSQAGELNLTEINQAFKQALSIGADSVVAQLGQHNGFNSDPKIHIPLPSELVSAGKVLDKIGLGGLTQDLEVKLNRAAELATPKAKQLFKDAITQMKIEDVQAIYKGAEDSATQYFKRTMKAPLENQMKPIIASSLSQVGAISAYNQVTESYKDIPFVPDLNADLTEHVVDLGIEGIFLYLAEEEAKIRKDPTKQVTELLKKVFSQ